jgi:hypothetical protein
MPKVFIYTTVALFAAALILALMIVPIRKMMSGVQQDGAPAS